jgi:NAD(P)-dependent dehydrogenase (short-subunit alcohol dehydrogenase family)
MSRGTVLVTGTSSGIGRATALHLATCGFDVLAGVRDPGDGDAVRSLAPERISPVVLDVTDPAQIATAIELASSTGLFGLVNNAGLTVQGPVEYLAIDDFRRQLEVNVVGIVALTQAALPLLRASRGRIVMVSSVGGRMAIPFVSPYHASKFALEGFSDALRMEVRPLGVEVAIVEPGSVKTEIWRKGAEAGRRQIDALAPEARALYGKRLEAMLDTARKTGARGIEPVEVAEAIEDALTARRPKTRYLVGADARAQATMKAVLPTRLLDRLTRLLSGT